MQRFVWGELAPGSSLCVFFFSNSKLVRDRSALKKLSFFSFGGGGGIKEAFLHTHFEAEHSRLNIKPS